MRKNALLRLNALFENEKIEKLKNATVLIAGLGGVGGFALEALCRSGIRNFILIDADVFEESNLNRQILSLDSNIGLAKTDVAEKRILSVNPDAHIETHSIFLDKENIGLFLDKKPDVVVDAIDSVESKCFLIKSCIERNINIVSSMGAALRIDPTQVFTTDISKTQTDPLAKTIRNKLRNYGISSGLDCVYSKEKPARKGAFLGSYAPVVGTFGLCLANLAINKILL